MQKFTQSFIKYTIWAIIFAASSYAYATSEWAEPEGEFPNGNKDAPINAGSVAQTKTGPLTIGTLPATPFFLLTTEGISSLGDAHFATNIGVGTVTDPSPLGLVGLFNGNVGAAKYCNQTGGNCVNPDGQKVVYITDKNHVYTTTSLQTGANRGGSSAYLGLTKTGAISLTSLKSSSSEFAAETRTIKGIIVSYSGTVTSGNIDSANLWYSFDIKGNPNAGDSYPSHQSQHIYYDYSGGVGTLPLYGGPLILIDGDSDSTFEFWWNLFRTTVANINISLNFQVTLSVIGYITE